MPTIALITDFGIREWYVGVMKGVIRSIAPECSVIDISHHVHAQQVKEAGFVLWNAYRYFPKGTIFTSVVDPGVGSGRAIMAVEAGDHYYIAPDNGLLDFVLSECDIQKAVKVDKPDYYLNKVTNTFHGRDIFSPVSAHLAKGAPLEALGKETTLAPPSSPFLTVEKSGQYEGEILYVDQFGNLITNLALAPSINGQARIQDTELQTFVNTYAEVEEGTLLMLRGSSGLLEISERNGSAAKTLGVSTGTNLRFKAQ